MRPTTFNKLYLLRISFLAALGGYLFGFDFAVIAGALPFLKTTFSLSAAGEGFLTGTLALGCIAGCLLAGQTADRYGRKPGLLAAALLFALSSIGMALSPGLEFLLLARFCAGIGVGMASMLSPLYISEVSPAHMRGKNVAVNQLTIVLGILITNLVNYSLAGGGNESWRWMFGLGFIPAMLFFLGVLGLPESPRWLIKAGRRGKAMTTLEKMGGKDFATATLYAVEVSLGKGDGGGGLRDGGSPGRGAQGGQLPYKAIFSRTMRPLLGVGVTLAVFQQLCGINIVFNYTTAIFATVGADINHQLLETVAIGLVNLIFTLFAMWSIDRWGRRPLLLAGSLGLSILYIGVAVALQGKWNMAFVSVFVLLAIACYASSLAPVTWVIISEIFPNSIRGAASSFSILTLWLAYFVLVFTFPILAERLGAYGPFYFYSGICLLGFLFIRSKVKETKGRTLEELEDSLS